MIRAAEWPAGALEQLDTLWFMSVMCSRLGDRLGESQAWRGLVDDPPDTWDGIALTLARDPLTLPIVAPLLDSRGRYIVGITLADTLAEMACLLGAGPLWWTSPAAISQVGAAGRPGGLFHVKHPEAGE
jgi:hypothetical protein